MNLPKCNYLLLNMIAVIGWCVCFLKQSGAQDFTEVSQQAGISHHYFSPILVGGGVCVIDFNNDLQQDIYFSGGFGPDKLYRNNGDGSFTEIGISAGVDQTDTSITIGVVAGDINNDGYKDIFITRWEKQIGSGKLISSILYKNNGNSTFTDITISSGVASRQSRGAAATMGDYNLDGSLDIYVINYVDTQDFIMDHNGSPVGYAYSGFENFFFKNNGNETFTEVGASLFVNDKGTGLAGTFSDFDNDGDLDIFVVNDYGSWVLPNKLYRNEFPADSFTDISNTSGFARAIYGMGIAIGDYDENGYLDYYVTNIGNHLLHRNFGNGIFFNSAGSAGVLNSNIGNLLRTGWGTAFFDYDNDTYVDIFVSNGHIPVPSFIANVPDDPNALYRNNGDGTFSDQSIIAGINDSCKGRGMAYGDFNNDGLIDFVVANAVRNDTTNQFSLVYLNTVLNNNHWLKVQLQGTTNNRDGFGSRVEVYAGGRKFIREIDGGSSHASQNSSIAHFGLASYPVVDSIVVLWLGGTRQSVQHIHANKFIKIIEGGAVQLIHEFHNAICAGDSFYAGGAFRTAQGIYRDTTAIATGIDSVAITRLTVHPIPATPLYNEICQGDSFLYRGDYYYTDTTLQDTLISFEGCDSIVTFTLHVTPFPVTNESIHICEGDSFYAGGVWQSSPGTYFDTIPSAQCNRITITNLNVIPPLLPDTVTTYLCPGDSIWLAGAFRDEENFYADTFASVFGCDSIVITWLDIAELQPVMWDYNICFGDTAIFGSFVLTRAGYYYDTLEGFTGCDSIVIVHVEADTSYAIHHDWTITAGDSFFAGGVWRKETGVYLDRLLADNGCDSIIYTHLYVDSLNALIQMEGSRFSIYPNPTNSSFTINYTLPAECDVRLEILSLTGKSLLLHTETKTPGMHVNRIDVTGFPSGVYLVSFITPHSTYFRKVTID